MPGLRVYLFGPLRIVRDGRPLPGLEAGKAQELFAFLLLHPGRAFPRETLAEHLWEDLAPGAGRKVLRQAIWQLQAAVDLDDTPVARRLLELETGLVRLNLGADLWSDAAELERLGTRGRDVPGRDLDAETADALERAVALYQGDLLEGWYQEWCLHRRQYLQNLYLQMLVRLMEYWETRGAYENSMTHGSRILEREPAHERTHRHLMRLHYLAGDRTAAIRQYQRCIEILRAELGVAPSRRTTALYEQIRADQVDPPAAGPPTDRMQPAVPLDDQLRGLRELAASMAQIQGRLHQSIQSIELALGNRLPGDGRRQSR
jgi:DNA-binding SARP family transcriptional activator